MDPGPPGKSTSQFVGLEEPPIVTTGLPGRHFNLESIRRGSIEVGTQIYYRQIRVGEVVAYGLAEDGMKIVSKIFVHAPYHQFVRKTTRFWNASGLDVKVDAKGLQVDMESIVSILVGGIAFDFLEPQAASGEPAEEGHTFTLYPSRDAAQEKVYATKNYYVLCPDGKPIRSLWHTINGRQNGVDFRYIYENRRQWWFCDTFIPSAEHFVRSFEVLRRHIPTTGFACILDVLACDPQLVTLTGFDYFASLHNVDEAWRPGNPEDPIGHRPEYEAQWLADHAHEHLLMLDETLSRMLNERRRAA